MRKGVMCKDFLNLFFSVILMGKIIERVCEIGGKEGVIEWYCIIRFFSVLIDNGLLFSLIMLWWFIIY